MHKAFYGKRTECFAHAQTVCTRPLLAEEGPGNEAKVLLTLLTSSDDTNLLMSY